MLGKLAENANSPTKAYKKIVMSIGMATMMMFRNALTKLQNGPYSFVVLTIIRARKQASACRYIRIYSFATNIELIPEVNEMN